MPNLIPSIDTSDVYNEDIIHFYEFEDCHIDNLNFRLKYANGDFNGDNSHIYLLVDNAGRHLAIMRLVEREINGTVYHQISKSYSLIPQKGYGEILYESCLKIHDNDIVSDNLNTLPGSFNLWRKIINKNNIAVFRFDTTNNRRSKIQLPLNDFLIWGVPDTFLEAIKSTPWDAVVFPDDSDNEIDDDSDDAIFVDYLTESDIIQRTILSDFIVTALQNRKRIKNRGDILLLIKKQ